MALLDPKHLVAPFHNTVHLVTIIAVVLLFVVFRLATGGIEFEDTTAAMRAVTQPNVVTSERTQRVQPAETVPQAAANTSIPHGDGNLQDIERALGLTQ